MNFRDQAATELTGVVDRLTASAEAAARTAAAEAQAAAQVTIDTLRTERAAVDRALQEEQHAKAALEQARAGVDKARTALEKERDALRTSLASTRTEAAGVKRDLQAKLDAARTEAAATKSDLQAKLDAARAEAAATKRDLQAKLDAARTEAADTKRDLQTKLEAAHGETSAIRRDLEAKLADARRAATEASTRANEWRLEQALAMRDSAITFVARSLDRLLAVSESFVGVSTADEVLAAMVAAMSSEFSRVALFSVAGDRLEGVHHVGFDFPADMSHLVIPHEIDSALTRAITSAQIETLSAAALDAAAGTAFGGTPKCALAMPVDLGGETFAVIYADDSDQPHQAFANVDLRRKFAALLRQQAAPLLMRLPTELKAVAEFREYAARLVAELENMYAADVAARKKGEELRRRLKDNVECARGIYAQRVAAEAPSASGLIEHELARTVAAKRTTAYGRDLTAVLGGTADPVRRPHGAPVLVEP